MALYKLVEATMLTIVGVGVLRLVNRDIAALAEQWVHRLHLDPDYVVVHTILATLTGITPRRLAEISAGSFAYALLRVVEGVGLWLGKRWAEYLTIIATAALVPVEVYEVVQRLSIIRVGALVLNLAIVAYLAWQLRRPRPSA